MNQHQSKLAVIESDEAHFESEVLRSELPVLVLVSAPWSHACQVLNPVVTELADRCAKRVKLVLVNADENPDLGMWYEVQFVPTWLLFFEGRVVARMHGTISAEALFEKLHRQLESLKPGKTPPDTKNETD